MVKYDSSVIQVMAKKLYSQARMTELTWSLAGLVGGGLLFGAGATALDAELTRVGAMAGALFGIIGGFGLGRSRAFVLRLTAQTALCQVQIERNTAAISGQ